MLQTTPYERAGQAAKGACGRHWDEYIVVDEYALGTPDDKHRLAGVEQQFNRSRERVQPRRHGTQRCRRPVEVSDPRSHSLRDEYCLPSDMREVTTGFANNLVNAHRKLVLVYEPNTSCHPMCLKNPVKPIPPFGKPQILRTGSDGVRFSLRLDGRQCAPEKNCKRGKESAMRCGIR